MRFRAIRAATIGALTSAAALVWTVPSLASSDLNETADLESGRPPVSIAQRLAVPAYFPPTGDALAYWDRLTDAGDEVSLAIANRSTAPTTSWIPTTRG